MLKNPNQDIEHIKSEMAIDWASSANSTRLNFWSIQR
jgi:hypothetical protein